MLALKRKIVYNNIITNGGNMEKREEIKINKETEVFFEAVIQDKSGYKRTFTKARLEDLQLDLDIWLKCGKYELVSADKVERVMCKLIA
jgi:hypothetical protein